MTVTREPGDPDTVVVTEALPEVTADTAVRLRLVAGDLEDQVYVNVKFDDGVHAAMRLLLSPEETLLGGTTLFAGGEPDVPMEDFSDASFITIEDPSGNTETVSLEADGVMVPVSIRAEGESVHVAGQLFDRSGHNEPFEKTLQKRPYFEEDSQPLWGADDPAVSERHLVLLPTQDGYAPYRFENRLDGGIDLKKGDDAVWTAASGRVETACFTGSGIAASVKEDVAAQGDGNRKVLFWPLVGDGLGAPLAQGTVGSFVGATGRTLYFRYGDLVTAWRVAEDRFIPLAGQVMPGDLRDLCVDSGQIYLLTDTHIVALAPASSGMPALEEVFRVAVAEADRLMVRGTERVVVKGSSVYRGALNPADGTVTDEVVIAVDGEVTGLAADGELLWVGIRNEGVPSMWNAYEGASLVAHLVTEAESLHFAGNRLYEVAADGAVSVRNTMALDKAVSFDPNPTEGALGVLLSGLAPSETLGGENWAVFEADGTCLPSEAMMANGAPALFVPYQSITSGDLTLVRFERSGQKTTGLVSVHPVYGVSDPAVVPEADGQRARGSVVPVSVRLAEGEKAKNIGVNGASLVMGDGSALAGWAEMPGDPDTVSFALNVSVDGAPLAPRSVELTENDDTVGSVRLLAPRTNDAFTEGGWIDVSYETDETTAHPLRYVAITLADFNGVVLARLASMAPDGHLRLRLPEVTKLQVLNISVRAYYGDRFDCVAKEAGIKVYPRYQIPDPGIGGVTRRVMEGSHLPVWLTNPPDSSLESSIAVYAVDGEELTLIASHEFHADVTVPACDALVVRTRLSDEMGNAKTAEKRIAVISPFVPVASGDRMPFGCALSGVDAALLGTGEGLADTNGTYVVPGQPVQALSRYLNRVVAASGSRVLMVTDKTVTADAEIGMEVTSLSVSRDCLVAASDAEVKTFRIKGQSLAFLSSVPVAGTVRGTVSLSAGVLIVTDEELVTVDCDGHVVRRVPGTFTSAVGLGARAWAADADGNLHHLEGGQKVGTHAIRLAASRMVALDGMLLALSEGELQVVDVRNPDRVEVIGRYPMETGLLDALPVLQDGALMLGGDEGVVVDLVRTPFAPRLIYRSGAQGRILDSTILEWGVAAAAEQYGTLLVREAGDASWSDSVYPSPYSYAANATASYGDRCFILQKGAKRVVRLEKSGASTQVFTGKPYSHMAVAGGCLAAAASDGLDLTNAWQPGTKKQTFVLSPGNNVEALVPAGDAFVVSTATGLFSVRFPALPFDENEVAVVPLDPGTSEPVRVMASDGARLYYAMNGQLRRLVLSGRTAPEVLAHDFVNGIKDMTWERGTLHVASGDAVYAVDTDAWKLEEGAPLTLGETVSSVDVRGDLMAVGLGEKGFSLYRLTRDGIAQVPEIRRPAIGSTCRQAQPIDACLVQAGGFSTVSYLINGKVVAVSNSAPHAVQIPIPDSLVNGQAFELSARGASVWGEVRSSEPTFLTLQGSEPDDSGFTVHLAVSGAWVPAPVTLTATVTGNAHPVDRVEFYHQPKGTVTWQLIAVGEAAPFVHAFHAGIDENGSLVKARVVDVYGYASEAAVAIVRESDANPPGSPNLRLSGTLNQGRPVAGAPFTVSADVSDGGSGIRSALLFRNNEVVKVMTTAGSLVYTEADPAEGEGFDFKILIEDWAGNVAEESLSCSVMSDLSPFVEFLSLGEVREQTTFSPLIEVIDDVGISRVEATWSNSTAVKTFDGNSKKQQFYLPIVDKRDVRVDGAVQETLTIKVFDTAGQSNGDGQPYVVTVIEDDDPKISEVSIHVPDRGFMGTNLQVSVSGLDGCDDGGYQNLRTEILDVTDSPEKILVFKEGAYSVNTSFKALIDQPEMHIKVRITDVLGQEAESKVYPVSLSNLPNEIVFVLEASGVNNTSAQVGDPLHLKAKVIDENGDAVTVVRVVWAIDQGPGVSDLHLMTTDVDGNGESSLDFSTVRKWGHYIVSAQVEAFPVLRAVHGFDLETGPPASVSFDNVPPVKAGGSVDLTAKTYDAGGNYLRSDDLERFKIQGAHPEIHFVGSDYVKVDPVACGEGDTCEEALITMVGGNSETTLYAPTVTGVYDLSATPIPEHLRLLYDHDGRDETERLDVERIPLHVIAAQAERIEFVAVAKTNSPFGHDDRLEVGEEVTVRCDIRDGYGNLVADVGNGYPVQPGDVFADTDEGRINNRYWQLTNTLENQDSAFVFTQEGGLALHMDSSMNEGVSLTSNWVLDNDFDLRVRLTTDSNVYSNKRCVGIGVVDEKGNHLVGVQKYNSSWRKSVWASFGNWANCSTYKYWYGDDVVLRIVRYGHRFRLYHSNGNDWVFIAERDVSQMSDAVRLQLYAQKTSSYPENDVTWHGVELETGMARWKAPMVQANVTGDATTDGQKTRKLYLSDGSALFELTDHTAEEVSVHALDTIPALDVDLGNLALRFAKLPPAVVEVRSVPAHHSMASDILFTLSEEVEQEGQAPLAVLSLDNGLVTGTIAVDGLQARFTPDAALQLNRDYSWSTFNSSWVGAFEREPILRQTGHVLSPMAALVVPSEDVVVVETTEASVHTLLGAGVHRNQIYQGVVHVAAKEMAFDWNDGSFTMESVDHAQFTDGEFVILDVEGMYDDKALTVANTLAVKLLLAGVDSDGDDMDNEVEVRYGLNPLVHDSAGDLDEDGISNGDEVASGTDPTNPDIISPEIVACIPADGAVGVNQSANVCIEFSETIRVDTVTATAVYLASEGNVIPADIHVTNNDTQICLVPHVAFEREAGVTVFVSKAVRDLAGNELPAPFESSFHIAGNSYTEQFGSGEFDLANTSVTFSPDGSNSGYALCRTVDVEAFYTDTSDGFVIPLTDDDYQQIYLSNSHRVSLHGKSYDTFFLGSNGNITFAFGDSSAIRTLDQHFSLPRLSALFDDLLPSDGGEVSWKELDDCVAVTYSNMKSKVGGRSSFQVEMLYDGTLRITWLEVGAESAIVGLSDGKGKSDGYLETDLVPQVNIEMSASATEGGESLTGYVVLPGITLESLEVNLTSSDESELSLSESTITIPEGEDRASFSMLPENDDLLDGSRDVTVRAVVECYAEGEGTIAVHDADSTSLSFSVDKIISEGDGVVTAQVLTGTSVDEDVIVYLNTTYTNDISVPATLTIPGGSSSASFDITIHEDDWIEHDEKPKLQASVAGWPRGEEFITIIDNESRDIVITLPDSITEGSGSVQGTLSLDGRVLNRTCFTLTSGNADQLTVPSWVCLYGGESSRGFSVSAVDDTMIDGTQSVQVRATAEGWNSGICSVDVLDNDPGDLRFEKNSVTVNENAGSVTLKVIRVGSSSGSISVDYQTVDGTAVAGSDFDSKSGTLSFEDGVISQEIVIFLLDDDLSSGRSKMFSVALNNATGGGTIVEPSVVQVVVRDDEFKEMVTEQFDGDTFDLDYTKITYEPAGEGYYVCRESIDDFPVNPEGGSVLSLSDDSFRSVNFGSESFSFYNHEYSTVHVGSNGYLTFMEGDTTYGMSLTHHFSMPRISMIFRDLQPKSDTAVSWKEMSDSIVITYQDIHNFNSSRKSSFQVQLYHDGTICVSYLDINTGNGIVGLSDGSGQLDDFVKSDFSSFNYCDFLSVVVPEMVHEGATGLSGTVFLEPVPIVDTAILVESNGEDITLSKQIVCEANNDHAHFIFDVNDNSILDGARNIIIGATCEGYVQGEANITVVDDENANISIVLQEVAHENNRFIQGFGQIVLDKPVEKNVSVILTSSDESEVTLASPIIIPAGNDRAFFDATIMNDSIIDGEMVVQISAGVPGWNTAVAHVIVHDDESRDIALELTCTEIMEGACNDCICGRVKLTGTYHDPLTLTISTTDDTELYYDSEVIIPAGDIESDFKLYAIDDSDVDGDVSVTVTASATDWNEGSIDVVVIDNDPGKVGFVTPSQEISESSGLVSVCVERTISTNGLFTVDYKVTGGSAVPGKEYTSVSGTLTFEDGVTERTIEIPIFDNMYQDGDRTIEVMLDNQTNSAVMGRSLVNIVLIDDDHCLLPFEEKFIGDSKPNAGWTYNTEGYGRIGIYGGDLRMGNTSGGADTMYESATLSLDLRDISNVTLSFEHRNVIDTNNEMESSFIDIANGDGVSISADGVTWYTIMTGSVLGGDNENTSHSINLDERVQYIKEHVDSSFGYGNGFKIRFQRYESSNNGETTKSRYWDNIVLTGQAVLTISANGPVTESSEPVAHEGEVTLIEPLGSDFVVDLVSLDTNLVACDSQVVIPAGETSATFNMTIAANELVDGGKSVLVYAVHNDYAPAKDTLVIEDGESVNMSIEFSDHVIEGCSYSMTLQLDRVVDRDVVVQLDTSCAMLDLPHSVIIPEGKSSVVIEEYVVNNNEKQGMTTAFITAHVPGWPDAEVSVDVHDNDVHEVKLSTIPGPVQAGVPVSVDVSVHDIHGVMIPFSYKSIGYSAAGEVGHVAVTPEEVYLQDGAWHGELTFKTLSTNVKLKAVFSSGESVVAESDSFEVVCGPIDYFEISRIETTQTGNTPFDVTVTAKDPVGNTITDYNGTVTFADAVYGDRTVLATDSFEEAAPEGWVYYAPEQELEATDIPNIEYSTDQARTGNQSVTYAPNLSYVAASKGYEYQEHYSRQQIDYWVRFDSSLASVPHGQYVMSGDQITNSLFDDGDGLYIMDLSQSDELVYFSNQNTGTVYNTSTNRWHKISHIIDWVSGALIIKLDDAVVSPAAPITSDYKNNNYQLRELLLYVGMTYGSLSNKIWIDDVEISGYQEIPVNTIWPQYITFENGQWTGSVTIQNVHDDTLIVADDGQGHKGYSNVFSVDAPPEFGVELDHVTVEGDEDAGILISLPEPTDHDVVLDVTVEYEDGSELTATVAIPSGQTEGSVQILVDDDGHLDGTQPISVSLNAEGYAQVIKELPIHDNEVTTLSFQMPSAFTEGGGEVACTLNSEDVVDRDVKVLLSCSQNDELVFPESVVITAGQNSSTFVVSPVDDTRIDGTTSMTMEARVYNWNPAAQAITVADNEARELTIVAREDFLEGDTQSHTIEIMLSGTLATNLDVSLASLNESQVTLPASCTIQAGTSSVQVPLTVINDTTPEGDAYVTLQASSDGFTTGNTETLIHDDDVDRFEFSTIPDDVRANRPFDLTMRALDQEGNVISDFVGFVDLSAENAEGAVGMTETRVGPFVSGIGQGSVTIPKSSESVRLGTGSGLQGTEWSNSFNVITGEHSAFTVDILTTALYYNSEAQVRVKAVDDAQVHLESILGDVQLGWYSLHESFEEGALSRWEAIDDLSGTIQIVPGGNNTGNVLEMRSNSAGSVKLSSPGYGIILPSNVHARFKVVESGSGDSYISLRNIASDNDMFSISLDMNRTLGFSGAPSRLEYTDGEWHTIRIEAELRSRLVLLYLDNQYVGECSTPGPSEMHNYGLEIKSNSTTGILWDDIVIDYGETKVVPMHGGIIDDVINTPSSYGSLFLRAIMGDVLNDSDMQHIFIGG